MQFPLMKIEKDPNYSDLGLPRSVPWELLSPHEEQAKKNHSQTLKRLAERGGLDPCEMAAVIQNKTWREASAMEVEDAAVVILEALASLEAA